MHDKQGMMTTTGVGSIVNMKPWNTEEGIIGANFTLITIREHKGKEIETFTNVRVMGGAKAKYLLETFHLGDQVMISGANAESRYPDKDIPNKTNVFKYIDADVFQLTRGATKATRAVFEARRAEREQQSGQQAPQQPTPPAAQHQAQASKPPQQAPQQPAPQYNEPPMDFDDDIPF